jgi:hypothetical protein
MALDLSPLKAILAKLESDDVAILESMLVPALLQEGVSLLPVADQALAAGVVAAATPALQAGLASLLAKIPSAA